MEETNFTDKALNLVTLAQKLAQEHSHPQILPIHILAAFCTTPEDGTQSYISNIITTARYDYQLFERTVNKHLVRVPSQTPAPQQVTMGYATGQVMQDAEKIKKQQKDSFIAQDHILFALLNDNSIKAVFKEAGCDTETIKTTALSMRGSQRIDSRTADTNGNFEFLSKYARDMTQLAREGKFDPVIGREEEVRATVRILARRSKSNAVLVGPAGVGKTSICECVAQKVVDNDVPKLLQGCLIYSLDLAALTAGTKYRGEFEERLKGIITEIEKSKQLIVLFVDEIHMLMGSGNTDTGSAANILKPALARGDLKVIGATTSEEYRMMVSKDGAFERRFQTVNVREPTTREAIAILRGVQQKYEIHHGVRILDSALVKAAQLAKRYLSYRRLPDSAIDLVDIACASVAVARDSKPEELDLKERELELLEIEIKALERDSDTDPTTKERLLQARKKEASMQEELAPLRAKFQEERKSHEELTQAKRKMEDLENKAQDAERRHDTGTAADLRYFAIPDLKKHIEELEAQVAAEDASNSDKMIKNVVDSDIIAETAARLTGIPVSKLSESENTKLINMERDLAQHVVGQGEAVKAVSNAIRLSRSGLANPRQPASFLFLGLSGSGKTELAKKLADLLFNDENAMIRIDCSELSEKHSGSKLLGTTAGYIGYEEGGLLTNQLERKPYTVILFDEVEKAAPEVLTIMLQMLDDGRITSGQGKTIDCSNAIIIMTSNLGATYIASQQGARIQENTRELVMNTVKGHFRPEFLNRISSIVVFNKLSRKAIHKIVTIRIKELEDRFEENDRYYHLVLSPEALEFLATHGYSEDLGARPLNRLIQREILNKLTVLILKGQVLNKEDVRIQLNNAGDGLDVLPNHEISDEAMDVDVEDWTDSEDEDEEALPASDNLD